MLCHLILHYRDGKLKDVASGSFPPHWDEPIFLPFAQAFLKAGANVPSAIDRIVFERRGKARKGKTSLYANYYEIERPKNPVLEAENRTANEHGS